MTASKSAEVVDNNSGESIRNQSQCAFDMQTLVRPTREYPRCCGVSIVELNSGDLLLAYCNYNGRGDNDRAFISARRLDPSGRPVGEEFLVVKCPPKGLNTTGPALRRLPDGRLGMLYNYRINVTDASRRFISSLDEGYTWSEPTVITESGYFTGCPDRFLILSTGRFIAPLEASDNWDRHYTAACVAWSDDEGESWSISEKVQLPWVGHKYGWQGGWIGSGAATPCVAERSDGTLIMCISTAMGTHFISDSYDGGQTWTSPRSMEVISPQAPACISRLPGSNDLLMLWTPNFNIRANAGGRRQTILSCVSTNGGRSWPHRRRKILVRDNDRIIDCPSVFFRGDEAWVLLRVSEGESFQESTVSTNVMHIPTDWFYRTRDDDQH